MSETTEIVDSKSESTETGNVTAQQLQEYSNLIKQRAQYYKEENTKMEEIFRKLKLLTDEQKLVGLGSSIGNLDNFMAEIESKNLSINDATLGQAEKLRKQNNYVCKLKMCIRHYINLNNKLSKEIKSLKWELEQSKQNVSINLKLFTIDFQQLEEKAKKYEDELVKFEKKYPWLKSSEYDFPNMAKYIDMLNSLKRERDSLVEELSIYKNLKPDIKEAKQQLAELKEQIKSDMANFAL